MTVRRYPVALTLALALALTLTLLPAATADATTNFTAQLFGQAEIPPVQTDDYGTCAGILSEDETVFTLSCDHTVNDATAAHIHTGFGDEPGPVLFDLGSATSPIQAEWLLDEDDAVRLRAGGLYVNVHTAANPGGRIRGQLLPNQPLEGNFLSFPLRGEEVVPSATTSSSGACYVTADFVIEPFLPLRDVDLRVRCAHDMADATSAVLVIGGARGETGTETLSLGSGNSPIDEFVELSGRVQANAFQRGELYVQILSDSHPDGELRGQLAGCLQTPETLCLNGDRFQVSMRWDTQKDSDDAVGVRETDDSGMFWFFRPSNLEVLVKVLDGCAVNDHYWVFFSATTNVGFDLQVTDTLAGLTKTYANKNLDPAQPVLDTAAFMTCP